VHLQYWLQGFQPLQVTVKGVKNAGCVRMLLDHGADTAASDHAVSMTVCVNGYACLLSGSFVQHQVIVFNTILRQAGVKAGAAFS